MGRTKQSLRPGLVRFSSKVLIPPSHKTKHSPAVPIQGSEHFLLAIAVERRQKPLVQRRPIRSF